jgi:tRNA A-37 threonylcarbamoyl transferase component Bud32
VIKLSKSIALKLAFEFNILNQLQVDRFYLEADLRALDINTLFLNENILNQKSIQKLVLIEKNLLLPSESIVKGLFNLDNLFAFSTKLFSFDEQERLAKEKAEQERLAKEKAEQERLAKEKAEQERLAKEKAEQERLAKEKAEQEKPRPVNYPEVFDVIGKCQLTTVLGHGATAQVYLAFHNFLRKNVAIKVLSPKLVASQPDIEKKFLFEAVNSAKLDHNNLVRVLDAGRDEKYTYMIVEYIDGPTLLDLIKQSGAIKPSQSIKIMIDVCQALDYALNLGLIHRDIKPDNIMVTKQGVTKLADFGLAKIINNPDVYQSSETGKIYGTPFYLPPEQILSKDEDHRYDMYSLGATFYHILTGRPPFIADNIKDIIHMHLKETPIPPDELSSEISQELSQIVLKLMEKDPNDRFKNYKELIVALDFAKNIIPKRGTSSLKINETGTISTPANGVEDPLRTTIGSSEKGKGFKGLLKTMFGS